MGRVAAADVEVVTASGNSPFDYPTAIAPPLALAHKRTL